MAGRLAPALEIAVGHTLPCQYGTHHSYVLVVHTLRVAENEILKLDLPAKRHL
jgi:hypothetical protein